MSPSSAKNRAKRNRPVPISNQATKGRNRPAPDNGLGLGQYPRALSSRLWAALWVGVLKEKFQQQNQCARSDSVSARSPGITTSPLTTRMEGHAAVCSPDQVLEADRPFLPLRSQHRGSAAGHRNIFTGGGRAPPGLGRG